MTSWESPDLGRSEKPVLGGTRRDNARCSWDAPSADNEFINASGPRILAKGAKWDSNAGAFYANWRQLNTALGHAVSKARETRLPVVIPPIPGVAG
jgi:hypothetical protein